MSKTWIQTYSGKVFYPLNPKIEDIDIIDIAHSLSMMCRFVGHSQRFYSVAQHSIIVSQHCDQPYKMQGLLHDASEAYISDLARPIKKLKMSEEYKKVEANIMNIIFQKFNIVPTNKSNENVKLHDDIALFTEKRDLMRPTIKWENEDKFRPYDDIIIPWLPEKAEYEFYKAFSIISST